MITSNYKKRQYRKTLCIIIMSQIFSGAGLAAGITVGAILAERLLKSEALTGLPSMLFTIGSALAAYFIGKITNQYGRRWGLSIGFLLGSIGAFGVVYSYIIENIYLLLLFLFIYGSGASSNLLSRYAATDLAEPDNRGKSISIAMIFTTIGVLVGPVVVNNLHYITNTFYEQKELDVFVLAGIAFALSFVVIIIFMRPDPYILSLNLEENDKELNLIPSNKYSIKNGILIGAITMIMVQIIMISVMTMMPLHMKNHHHSLTSISFTIGIHIASMYLPSLFSGFLIDKIGAKIMIIFSSLILTSACILAAFSPENSLILLTISLSLLGIGWNFGFISGSTILVNSTISNTRAKIQGMIDVYIALSGALASFIAGIIVANVSFIFLALLCGVFSLFLIIVLKINNLSAFNEQ